MSFYMIPGWRGMVNRMRESSSYRWKALTGLFVGSVTVGIAVMSAISPGVRSRPGGPARQCR